MQASLNGSYERSADKAVQHGVSPQTATTRFATEEMLMTASRTPRFLPARRLSTAVIAGVLALTSCGGGDATGRDQAANGGGDYSAAEQELYDAAQDEPTLMWYSAQIPELDELTIDAFTKRYPGLEVEYLRLASGELTTRYSGERTAGTVPAGLMTAGSPAFFDEGMEKGWFEPELDLPELENWPEEYYADGVARMGILPYYLSYNTDQLSEDEAPKTWEDLTDPSLRGKIHFGDPRAVPGYLALAYILRDEYGDDYLKGLAQQKLTLVPSIVPGNQTLAAGGSAVLAPNVHSIVAPLVDEGAAIEMVEVNPTTGSEYLSAVSTETKSPNSARLLLNFLLTEEGQAVFNGEGGSSPLGDVGQTIPLPDGYQSPPIEEATAQRAELLGLLGISG